MGLSFDDYQKMMKSGQIGWNMDIINGTAKQINDMSDLIRGQQTAAEPRLSPGNFQEVQRQYGQISGNVAYMRAYGNFLKQNSPEDYNALSAHLGEIDRVMAPMKEWVDKGYDPQEYKQAEDARKLYAVREMRGGASAGDVEKKYGFKADEMQELYQNVLEYEKQEELSGKYDNKSVDELLEVIRDPDRLGQQVYNDIAKEYSPGDFQKMIKDKDYDWIFERYGSKYGLSAENVKNIVGQISNYDDKHYESMKGNAPKIADKDEREYILSRILEKGNGDELEKLRKSLPGENDPEYDNWKSLSSAVNDKLINERKMKQYYLDVKEKYPDASDDELEKKGVDVEKYKLWRERYQAQSVNKLQDLLIKAFTQSSPAAAAAASVASVPVNMIGSLVHDVPQYIGANIDRLTGGDGYIDPEGTINSKVQAVRDATMEMMGDDHPLAQFLYSTGMSMGESGFAMLVNLIPVVGPALSNAMFFSNAGVSAANDVIKNGGSLGQATATMVAFGAVELLTERFSLEKLKALQANGNVKSAKELFLNILKQGTTEGSEEVAATLADSFADGLINRDNSEFNRNIKAYMEQGLSREEAESRAWGDWWKGLAMDAAGGALSGAIFGGATSAANYRTGKQAAKVGNLEVTQAEFADLAGEDNKEAVKTAEGIVKKQGVSKVLEAAKLSENEEVKQTAAHFEEVAKKSKLDEGDVAQLLVKASQAQIESNRFDAFAREMGVETRADYIEKSGKSAELLQNYDLSGAKLEEGRTAATSSFGAAHPNGVAAVDQNGKQVVVTGIDSSVPEYGRNDNTVSVVLSDGRTVDAGSVTFDNSDIQRLVNMAARFDSVGARALLANYEEAAQSGVGVDAYEQSFARLYEIAQKGSSFDSLRKNAEYGADIAALGENVARAAVEAGLADGDISSQTRSFFQKRVRVNGRNFSESKVHFDRDVKLDKNSDVLSVLQGVAEATGKKVVVTHALNTEDKGVYVNNTIYINADQAEHAMVTAALHEAVHNMRAYSEEDFRTLQKFVMNYLVASGQDVERMLASIAALYGKDAPDLDVQVEELVCKTVESLAANREALETALDVKQNKSIREKVGEILQKIADKVMSYFKGDKENGLLAHNRYAQVFLDDAKALQEMAQIVRQGFANAKANEREFGSKESEERFSKIYGIPKNHVFPPYDESKSDANEQAMRWARLPDVSAGDQRLASYHGRWYIIEKFDDMPYGYQIVDLVEPENIENVREEMEERRERRTKERMARKLDGFDNRYRRTTQDGGERSNLDSNVLEYSTENNEVRELGKNEVQGRHNSINPDESAVSGDENRQGNGTARLTNDPNARKSKDDAIYDSAEIEDLFNDYEDSGNDEPVDVKKLLRRMSPDEAIFRLSDRIGRRAVEAIRAPGVELTEEEFYTIAERMMKGYNIKLKGNEALKEKIAKRIALFAENIRNSPKSDYSVHMNALYSDCRKYLESSGKYERGFMQDTAQKVKAILRGRTLILPQNAATYILGDYGSLRNLNNAYGGYISVVSEADKAKAKNPIYMEALLQKLGELQPIRELFPDAKTPDDYTGWGFLDNLIENVLKPKFVNPYYGNVYENMEDAALEMANRIAVAVVDEMAGKTAASGKALRIVFDSRNALVSDNEALQKVKLEKYRSLKQVNNYYVSLEKTNFRKQYAERQKKNAALRQLGQKFNSLTKRLDGKANKNEYIPETLKKPILEFLELFDADPGNYKNGKPRSENKFKVFRDLTKVKERVNALAEEYARLEGKTQFEDALGFDINALAFDKSILNELRELGDLIGEKNVYQLNSDELYTLLGVMNDLDNHLKHAVEIIVDGQKTTIEDAAKKGIDEMQAVYYKKDSKNIIADWLRDARNRFVATSLDPVRYGKFLSGYKEGAVWNLLMNDLHSGDQKRVRIMQQAYSAVQTVTAKYRRKDLRNLQRKAVSEFTMKDTETGEDVKLSQGMLLTIYLTDKQADGHRHLCANRANHYTLIADLDKLNGNRVLPDARGKKQKAEAEYGHKVQFTAETLERIQKYVESTPILTDMAAAMHKVLNGLLADEINMVSMQRYGKLIATVKNYFPIRIDHGDTNKKFETSFEGENIFTDQRMKSRGFTKQRTWSDTAIVIGDAMNVFQRHVNETAEYCGMLIPVENIKKVINSDNGEITMRTEITRKFGGSAVHYLNKLLGEIQQRKDTIDENLITSLSGHAMGAALAFNPRSWLKNYGALPLAYKHFGAGNVAKAVAATKAGWGKIGKDLVEKYNDYTPYMWYREQGNGTVVGELSRQHGLYGKFADSVDMMGKFDRAVVNLLLYASEENVKQTTKLEVDSEDFKKEVAKRFEKCVDESQPNSMITSKPQFVRNNVMRVLNLNAFASQRMAMGNSMMDSFMEFRARSYEAKMDNTKEAKVAKKKALKDFVYTFFGAVQSAGLQDLLGVLTTVLLFHKWDDLKDEEGNVTLTSALLGGGIMILKDFPEEFFGSFAWMDRAYSFIEKRFDKNAYGSDFNVMSFSAVEDIVKSIDSGNWAKAWGRFADLSGLYLIGGGNQQKLIQSGYSYFNDIINGRLGFTANNGKTDFDHLAFYIINAYDSGNRSKGAELTRMWVQQKMSEGQTEENAVENVNKKLAAGLAQTDAAKQAMMAGAGGEYAKAEKLKAELAGKGFSAELVDAATAQALRDVYAMLKAEKPKDREETESLLLDYGFDDTGAAEIAAKWDSQKTNVYTDYQYSDAFNALKNGDKEGFAVVKAAIMTERQKDNKDYSEKDFMSQMKSSNHTKPLFEELEAATDGNDRKRLERVRAQLLNVFGSESEWRAAYQKYVEKKNK